MNETNTNTISATEATKQNYRGRFGVALVGDSGEDTKPRVFVGIDYAGRVSLTLIAAEARRLGYGNPGATHTAAYRRSKRAARIEAPDNHVVLRGNRGGIFASHTTALDYAMLVSEGNEEFVEGVAKAIEAGSVVRD